MIKIKIFKENNYYKTINICGHANYDEYGKDIVCASVSSIVITTINAIECLTDKTISYNNSNNLSIIILNENEITNKLLDNMVSLLNELSREYEGTIKFL